MSVTVNTTLLVSSTFRSVRYIGGSYRNGVSIVGFDKLNSIKDTYRRAKLTKRITAKLERSINYKIGLFIFIDRGEESEIDISYVTSKSLIPKELDNVITVLLTQQAESVVGDGEKWGYGFVAVPYMNYDLEQDEDYYIELFEREGVWDQNIKKEVLRAWEEKQKDRLRKEWFNEMVI